MLKISKSFCYSKIIESLKFFSSESFAHLSNSFLKILHPTLKLVLSLILETIHLPAVLNRLLPESQPRAPCEDQTC